MTFLDDKQAERDDLIDAHERENGILKFRPMEISDIRLAVFALGHFVQYRLDEGMDAAYLEDFMQAYLNLTARLEVGNPSTANRDFTSSETANGNSDSTNAQALSKTPEAPIVSKSTETPRQEITEDTMN